MRIFAPILLFLLLHFVALTNSSEAAGMLEESDKKALETFLNTNANHIITILDQESSKDNKKQLLTELFYKIFDYEWMGKFVIAKHWRAMSEHQQSEYLDAYKRYLSALYVSKYSLYRSQKYHIKDISTASKHQFIITTEIIAATPEDQNAIISYRVRKDSQGFLHFVDIIVEGVSLLSNQRADFGAIIEKKGLDALTAILKGKKL